MHLKEEKYKWDSSADMQSKDINFEQPGEDNVKVETGSSTAIYQDNEEEKSLYLLC